eukprot:CAMPEP_0176462972 /NCGR_PEP_ID=MMETSP0127-20121128/35591_1 /TAXON_ID=938130 /ORGANISM="Platyophrya macrostoma, Strain WH" /LENGTH=52 /DNA_ID=CAMNT_0017855003 /DNA_START=143 /DNA_END=298 /DNA_ORIENTATION=+
MDGMGHQNAEVHVRMNKLAALTHGARHRLAGAVVAAEHQTGNVQPLWRNVRD